MKRYYLTLNPSRNSYGHRLWIARDTLRNAELTQALKSISAWGGHDATYDKDGYDLISYEISYKRYNDSSIVHHYLHLHGYEFTPEWFC